VVLAVKLVRLLVKLPVPLPLVVKLLAVVGLGELLHTIPLCVTGVPPLYVMLPPELAELLVMLPIGNVVIAAKLPGLIMV
jgi:hypothetical protein